MVFERSDNSHDCVDVEEEVLRQDDGDDDDDGGGDDVTAVGAESDAALERGDDDDGDADDWRHSDRDPSRHEKNLRRMAYFRTDPRRNHWDRRKRRVVIQDRRSTLAVDTSVQESLEKTNREVRRRVPFIVV